MFITRLIVSTLLSKFPDVRMRLFSIFILSITAATLVAQENLSPAVPLVAVPGLSKQTPGAGVLSLQAAQRAQKLGFPSAAVALYEELLAQPGSDRAALTLALVTALLDEGQVAEANSTLESYVGPKSTGWYLRAGLVAAKLGDYGRAREELASLKAEDFSDQDRGWFHFLQGVLADQSGELGQARAYYEQAENAAVSELARARFVLARVRARLHAGPVDEALAEEAERNMVRLEGRKGSYGFARTYAAMLNALDRKDDAVAVLQRQLLLLPAEERSERDEFYLLLGLIAGEESAAGWNSLVALLKDGIDRTKQRVALQLLAREAQTGTSQVQFRRLLDVLLAQEPPHTVLEDLLLVRSQVALTAKDYRQAEVDARRLLEQFPGSPLKVEAYGVLTGSAWGQRRYRAAADLATKAQQELTDEADAQTRAELGVLVAEAWFRARDFPNAANAYSAVLREVPAGVPAGDLMFQRVLADIESGRLDIAQEQLDAMSDDARFDVVNRWQAEWNLARALQVKNRMTDAYARVNALLSDNSGERSELPDELLARMVWLQARLSLQAGQPDRTLELVDALVDGLPNIPEELAQQISSSGALLKAEAFFELDRKQSAIELLQKLRNDYPSSDAAIYSIIVEADYHANRDQTVEAQRLYTKLADDFPGNTSYAPYALFQAALQAERRGQDANLVEANKLIEDLVTRYPASPLVFYARLKQGGLLRKLNQFPQAQLVYENLVNNHPNHGDVILAQLALAECHNAQSLDDTNHAERAISLFEHLRDRVDAPVDVRVEAGFNLGYLMARRGRLNRAEAVWWRDVVTTFLLDEDMATALGPKGRYWMTRSILELGSLYEQQAKLDQARDAWSLILKTGLPGAALAEDRLARFQTSPVAP